MAYLGPKPSQTLATPTSQYFNGTGSQTVFTLNRAVNVSEDLEVFVNNIQQEPGVGKSYTASGTTLTFDAAPSSGTANVYVVYRGLAEVTTRLEHDANSALAATTGTFSGNVGIGETSPVTPLTITTANKLGSTFTGNINGEGLTVTQTNYTDGNYISLVEAAYDDSNDANPNVRIGAKFTGAGSSLAFGTSNNYGAGINNTAMTIDYEGKVGIGQSNPAYLLTAEGDKDTWISRIYNTGSDANAFGLLVRTDATAAHDALAFGVYADSGYKFVIRSNGNVGIGTTSPSTALDLGTTTGAKLTLYPSNYSIGVESNELRIASNAITSFYSGGHSGTERMRLTADGKVGIGSSSPSYKMTIFENGNNFLQFSSTGDAVAGHLIGRAASKNLRVQNSENANIEFLTNNAERMRITSGGNLLVGTTTASSHRIQAEQSTNIASFRMTSTNTSSESCVQFKKNGAEVGYINLSSTTTSYGTSSDYRLKTAVEYDWDATTRLKQLKPARFEWIADGDDAVPVDGFLAHEVQDIVPEAITGTKDGMRDEEYEVTPAVEATYDDEGNVLTEEVPAVMGTRSVPDYQGIDQAKLVPLLVKTIQELEARIAALEAN